MHERVSKRVALAVFSSDPISSTAYATEEILLVLVGAAVAGGALATGLALPVAVAGTTALTRVEAISNGVSASGRPRPSTPGRP